MSFSCYTKCFSTGNLVLRIKVCLGHADWLKRFLYKAGIKYETMLPNVAGLLVEGPDAQSMRPNISSRPLKGNLFWDLRSKSRHVPLIKIWFTMVPTYCSNIKVDILRIRMLSFRGNFWNILTVGLYQQFALRRSFSFLHSVIQVDFGLIGLI